MNTCENEAFVWEGKMVLYCNTRVFRVDKLSPCNRMEADKCIKCLTHRFLADITEMGPLNPDDRDPLIAYGSSGYHGICMDSGNWRLLDYEHNQ